MNSQLDGFSFLFKEIESLKKQVADLKAEMNAKVCDKPQVVAFKAEFVENLPTSRSEITICKGEIQNLFKSNSTLFLSNLSGYCVQYW